MGIKYKTETYPDLYSYEPEYNEDGTEKHIVLDGARFHVISWDRKGAKCSCGNCEINKRRKEG